MFPVTIHVLSLITVKSIVLPSVSAVLTVHVVISDVI